LDPLLDQNRHAGRTGHDQIAEKISRKIGWHEATPQPDSLDKRFPLLAPHRTLSDALKDSLAAIWAVPVELPSSHRAWLRAVKNVDALQRGHHDCKGTAARRRLAQRSSGPHRPLVHRPCQLMALPDGKPHGVGTLWVKGHQLDHRVGCPSP